MRSLITFFGLFFIAAFSVNGKAKQVELTFKPKQRRTVGRSKENDLAVEDVSVSKMHGALVFNSERQLLVADTGSTNGTYVAGQPIKERWLGVQDSLQFGGVHCLFIGGLKKSS